MYFLNPHILWDVRYDTWAYTRTTQCDVVQHVRNSIILLRAKEMVLEKSGLVSKYFGGVMTHDEWTSAQVYDLTYVAMGGDPTKWRREEPRRIWAPVLRQWCPEVYALKEVVDNVCEFLTPLASECARNSKYSRPGAGGGHAACSSCLKRNAWERTFPKAYRRHYTGCEKVN
jgi:hypothetical protein